MITGQDFQDAARVLYGPDQGRTTRFAEALKINERTMRRLMAGTMTPSTGIIADVAKLLSSRSNVFMVMARRWAWAAVHDEDLAL